MVVVHLDGVNVEHLFQLINNQPTGRLDTVGFQDLVEATHYYSKQASTWPKKLAW